MSGYHAPPFGAHNDYGHMPQVGHSLQSVYPDQVNHEEARAHLDRLFSGLDGDLSSAKYSLPRAPVLTRRQQEEAYAASLYPANHAPTSAFPVSYPSKTAASSGYHPVSDFTLSQKQYDQLQAEYAGQMRCDWKGNWHSTNPMHFNQPYMLQAPFQQLQPEYWPHLSQVQSSQSHELHKLSLPPWHHSQRPRTGIEAIPAWPAGAQELTYGENWDGRDSKENRHPLNNILEYHDHPSFAKPPHRQNSTQQAPIHIQEINVQDASNASAYCIEEPQLIAKDSSSIPPPPSIEKSAYPLAALAADLVWEAFLDAANKNSAMSASPVHALSTERGSSLRSRFDEPDGLGTFRRSYHNNSASPSTPSFHKSSSKSISPYIQRHDRSHSDSAGREAYQGTGSSGNSFGAIGGERRPRLNDGSPNSEISSPASSAPGTPSPEGPIGWMFPNSEGGKGFERVGGAASYWGEEDSQAFQLGKESHTYLSNGFMRASPLQQQIFTANSFPAPPVALYEQIQRLLAATLLSQQVLLLALFFVAKLPHTSPLYPPVTARTALQSTTAPFKLLLAAIVVANKHLDDNSFRNSTFSTVSNITLPEVNALEYSLLSALSFDINVETDTWLTWLQELEQQRTTRSAIDQGPIAAAISLLVQGVIAQQDQQKLAKQLQRHPSLSISTSLTSSPPDVHQAHTSVHDGSDPIAKKLFARGAYISDASSPSHGQVQSQAGSSCRRQFGSSHSQYRRSANLVRDYMGHYMGDEIAFESPRYDLEISGTELMA